jgi:hypothetical protein
VLIVHHAAKDSIKVIFDAGQLNFPFDCVPKNVPLDRIRLVPSANPTALDQRTIRSRAGKGHFSAGRTRSHYQKNGKHRR